MPIQSLMKWLRRTLNTTRIAWGKEHNFFLMSKPNYTVLNSIPYDHVLTDNWGFAFWIVCKPDDLLAIGITLDSNTPIMDIRRNSFKKYPQVNPYIYFSFLKKIGVTCGLTVSRTRLFPFHA